MGLWLGGGPLASGAEGCCERKGAIQGARAERD